MKSVLQESEIFHEEEFFTFPKKVACITHCNCLHEQNLYEESIKSDKRYFSLAYDNFLSLIWKQIDCQKRIRNAAFFA